MTFHLDLPYLNYILDIIEDIEVSINKISKDKFLKNKDTRDANVRRIEIIAETVKNLSNDVKKRYNNIDWTRLATIKDRIENQYFGINFYIIWEILKNDIPILKENILKIKNDLENLN